MRIRYTVGFLALMLSACTQLQMNIPASMTDSRSSAETVSSKADDIPAAISGSLVLGSAKAPVQMLLFTNYDCAYCRDFERNIMGRLKTDFINTGKLNVQVVILPLQKYPNSDRNAHTLLCGVKTGSGSDVHGRIFAGQTNFPTLKTCLEDDAYLQSMMAAQYAVIQSLDVTLVPTYFIDGQKFVGLPEYADIRGQVEEAMQK